MLQSILGVMMQCVLLGLVLAKIAKSKKRQKTLIFSNKAVITIRDNWCALTADKDFCFFKIVVLFVLVFLRFFPCLKLFFP